MHMRECMHKWLHVYVHVRAHWKVGMHNWALCGYYQKHNTITRITYIKQEKQRQQLPPRHVNAFSVQRISLSLTHSPSISLLFRIFANLKHTCFPTFLRASCSGVIVLSSSKAYSTCIFVRIKITQGSGNCSFLSGPLREHHNIKINNFVLAVCASTSWEFSFSVQQTLKHQQTYPHLATVELLQTDHYDTVKYMCMLLCNRTCIMLQR